MFCPLSGTECVGINECAPAVYLSKEGGGQDDFRCPIVLCTAALTVISTAVVPFLFGTEEDAEPEQPTFDREAMLRTLKVDQPGFKVDG